MKLLNIEDGYKCIYVQQSDLRFLKDYEHDIPKELEYTLKTLDSDTDPIFFKRFIDPVCVEYLNNLEWIYDLKKISKLSPKQKDYEIDYYIEAAEAVKDTILFGITDTEDFFDILLEYKKLIYIINSICNASYWYKFMSYPEAIDSCGFAYTYNDILFTQTLNPNTMIVKNLNGTMEDVDNSILEIGIEKFRQYRLKDDPTFDRLLINYELSRDKKEMKIFYLELFISDLDTVKDYVNYKIKTKKINRKITN